MTMSTKPPSSSTLGAAWDSMLRVVAPQTAARNLAAREFMATMDGLGFGYDAGGPVAQGRRRMSSVPRDADGDMLSQLGSLRSQCRDLARNNPIASGAINTNVDRIVGTGLALQPEPQREVLGWSEDQAGEFKKIVSREFALYSDSMECDQTHAGNFYDRQGVVLRSTLESGDCFTLLPDGDRTATMPYRLRLQVLEADRVGNPGGMFDTATVAGGIRRNAAGAPDAFYLYDRHPGSVLMRGASRWSGQWVERMGPSGRRRMLHHIRPLRPEQSRGVPYLAPIIGLVQQLGRYTHAEVQAAVVSAFFTVFITTEGGNVAPIFNGQQAAAVGQSDDLALGAGAIVGLSPNEKVEIANPNRPNTAFDGFVAAVIKQIGVALSLPQELLMKQFQSSYSASKAALLDAWVYFRTMRTWLSRSLCQPVYETWMAEAVATGRIAAPGFFTNPLVRWAYTRANWFGDSMGSINPKDEVAAYADAIDARLMTRERAEWELFGTPWDSTFEQKVREHEMLKGKGMLPAAKPGAPAPTNTPQPTPVNP
jgi:lambda family phage portal protein